MTTTWRDFFTGEERPRQVEWADGGTVQIDVQYQEPGGLTLDRFASGTWLVQRPGRYRVRHAGRRAGQGRPAMYSTGTRRMTHTGGLLRWDAAQPTSTSSSLPAASQDVSDYDPAVVPGHSALWQRFRPVGAPQDFFVVLTDQDGRSRKFAASQFASLNYPYVRGFNNLTKVGYENRACPAVGIHQRARRRETG